MMQRLRSDGGNTTIVVLSIGIVVTMLLVVSLSTSSHQVAEASRTVRATSSLHAAEGAVDDYISKLSEDHQYYLHYVHPAESTRRTPIGTDVQPGEAWSFGSSWTYPYGKNSWRGQQGGTFEYNLQIQPPVANSQIVKILTTGRRTASTSDRRAIEVQVRPASVADFQMIANRDIGYGTTASTYGKIYAGIDENNTPHNIAHAGTAYANLYAEGNITQQPTYRDGATGYTSSNIRTVIRNPINFNSFSSSLVDIQAAAQNGGIYLNNTSVDAWRLVLRADGTMTVDRCTRATDQNGQLRNVADLAPNCVPDSPPTRPMPANGAMFAGQSVIVGTTTTGSVVNGRLTVATNGNMVIGHNISYQLSGDDVLGLIARQDFVIARWCPNFLNWRAATIAQQLRWHSYTADNSKDTMTFTGSTATNLGGYMTMFRTRNYLYDRDLLYLAPPFFPILEEAYSALLYREVAP